MQEMVKWIQTYEQLNLSFPDEWDSLTDGTTIVNYLPNSGGATPLPSGGQLGPHALTQAEVDALNNLGIKKVHDLLTDKPESPTFAPYKNAVTAPTVLAAGSEVVELTPAAANEKLGLSINGTYLVFGLGKRCTLIGRTVAEAPVVSADEPGINPADFYGRFLIVVKVAQDGVTLPRAQFVGTVSMHPNEVDGAGQHLDEYYNITKSSK
jgi:hypothetical protein